LSAADREFIALGACNIASGLSQGFAVTGADSRTAMSDVMGGRTGRLGAEAVFPTIRAAVKACGHAPRS
jgi:MFS superfamily sulfate permease-like transporter